MRMPQAYCGFDGGLQAEPDAPPCACRLSARGGASGGRRRLRRPMTGEAGTAVVRLAARGDGVTADGRFVPGAVPGDLLLPDGRLLPGPQRVAPACRHFGTCGGCQLQHAGEAALADFARARCLEPLSALGIRPAEVRPVHLSPPGARRRASLRAARRDGVVRLGFSRRGAHALVDVVECPVLAPSLAALVPPLRALLARLLPPRGAVSAALALCDQGVDLLLSDLAPDRLDGAEALAAFAREEGLARLAIAGPDGLDILWEPEPATVTLGGVRVRHPPGAFLQATADGEAALVAAVREGAGKARAVADLFAGLGTFALPLSAAARVHAVEGSGAAVSALLRAARAAGRPVSAEHRDLFRRPLAAAELASFDAVVFDPPRSGAAAQAAELAQAPVPVAIAVSCNPATFARDALRLVSGGFRLETLWPVAQFRWSTHVELVARFERR